MSGTPQVGVVAKLWRYPVKSMLGEECRELELEERGFRGDRLFAVQDAGGKLGSGKNTRRFRLIDGLFGFSARHAGEWPEIAFPDGRRVRGDDPRIHGALSSALGTAVTLVREARIRHFDDGAVHLVTTAALEWLRSRLPGSRIDERRFRPNIVMTAAGAGQPEQSWIGRTLRIGAEVVLRVTAPTERCRMTTLGQADLPEDVKVLRRLAEEAEAQFGVYAEVVKPGRIATGYSVVLD
jgi:uncharacterized protein YcbX